ncbi:ABC transporter permease [Halalkalirubrum salinum]|uniref:ABC transporter permease n=1 Tax=Halalkalirubrum salinum TaxID=2563889 RepID=UPI0010FB00FE|nr:ABC transporter permease [Halalkalirubrum salinum]
MNLARYVLWRIVQTIPVLLGITTITFLLTNAMPGSPVDIMVGPEMDEALEQALKERYGLDRPLHERYLIYISNVLQGDLGVSFYYDEPVTQKILERLPVTALLVGSAYTFGLGIAIPLGVLSAAYRNRWIDHVSRVIALFGVSTPSFWIGLVLIIVFAFHLGWLPSSDLVRPWRSPAQVTNASTWLEVWYLSARSLVLPTIALGTLQMAAAMRIERSSMTETLGKEYIRLARGYGVPERTVLRRHAFRAAQLPVVTIVGLNVSTALGGSVLIETVFNINGMGRLIITGIQTQDYPLVMGTTLFFGVLFLVGVIITDISYAYIDPRVTYGDAE